MDREGDLDGRVRLLLIEDHATRLKSLGRAVSQFGVVTGHRKLSTLMQMDPGRLAEFDAVLVDFDLESKKNLIGDEELPSLTVNDETGAASPFECETGVSALLYLRKTFLSQAYARERRNYLAHRKLMLRRGALRLPEGWQPGLSTAGEGDLEPRLYSFVNARSFETSKLYAAAASAWFGTTYLDAQGSQEYLERALGDPLRHFESATSVSCRAAGRILRSFLTIDLMGDATWLEPHPIAFDWYRLYLHFGGKDGMNRMHNSCSELLGTEIRQYRRRNNDQFKPIAQRLQDTVWLFLREWRAGLGQEFEAKRDEEWQTPWEVGRPPGPDPLKDFLLETAAFWNAEDVRQACLTRTSG